MDSRGSYVITKQYGLGRIVDQSKDFISVKIPHLKDLFVISITNINISYFFISEEVIKKIIDIRSAIPFSSEIKTRAYAYATPNKLDNFRYFRDQAILEAAILGTYTYTVEIDLNRKEVTCTCPYQDYCKHEYALLSYIINQYDVLSKVEIEQPKPKEIVVKPIVEDIL